MVGASSRQTTAERSSQRDPVNPIDPVSLSVTRMRSVLRVKTLLNNSHSPADPIGQDSGRALARPGADP
jgi:hypothetical protein